MNELQVITAEPIQVQVGEEIIHVKPLVLKEARHVIEQSLDLVKKMGKLSMDDNEQVQDEMLLDVITRYLDDVTNIVAMAIGKDSKFLEEQATIGQMFRLTKAVMKVNEIGEVVSDFTDMVSRFMPKLTKSALSSSSDPLTPMGGLADKIIKKALKDRQDQNLDKTPPTPSPSDTTPVTIP